MGEHEHLVLNEEVEIISIRKTCQDTNTQWLMEILEYKSHTAWSSSYWWGMALMAQTKSKVPIKIREAVRGPE